MTLPGALAIADLLIGGVVVGTPVSAPPAAPVQGLLYLVAAGASGAFADQDGSLASWSEAGWRFVVPVDGMRLTERTSGVELCFRNGAWAEGSTRTNEVLVDGQQVVGARQPAIAAPVGGSVVDGELRAAVGQILVALRAHGLIAG